MKLKFLLSFFIILFFYTNPSKAQYHQELETDVAPSFRGGDIETFNDWVLKKVVYWSSKNIERDWDGYVTVAFTVNKRGQMVDVEALSTYDIWVSKRVMLAIDEAPAWTPAMKDGKPVAVRITTDIDFNRIGVYATMPDELKPSVTIPIFSNSRDDDNTNVDRDMLTFSSVDYDQNPLMGQQRFVLWLLNQLGSPRFEKNGGVLISFVVNKVGYVEKVEVLTGENPYLNAFVVRMMYGSPKWYKPGYEDGVPIDVQLSLPIIMKSAK